MTRLARMKVEGVDGWYHLHARIAGHQGEYPLSRAAPMRRLIETIQHFSRIYFCEVAAFSIPGNHYHLITKFEVERPVNRNELRARTRLMYPGKKSQEQIDGWSDDEWEHYRRRSRSPVSPAQSGQGGNVDAEADHPTLTRRAVRLKPEPFSPDNAADSLKLICFVEAVDLEKLRHDGKSGP